MSCSLVRRRWRRDSAAYPASQHHPRVTHSLTCSLSVVGVEVGCPSLDSSELAALQVSELDGAGPAPDPMQRQECSTLGSMRDQKGPESS